MALKNPVFPTALIPFVPHTGWRLKLARKAAGRGDARAMRIAPTDVDVLSGLGLHEAVLREGTPGVARLVALAAAGRTDELLAGLTPRRKNFPPDQRARIVRAIAPTDARVALALASPTDRLGRAALAIAIRKPDLARRFLDGETGDEAEILRAVLGGEEAETQRHIADAFAFHGLEAPVFEAGAAPSALGRLRADVPAGSVAGPLVSVVMPFHQAATTLAMAARSILAQSWASLELILVDDASTDDGAAIAAELARSEARIVVLANQRARGAAGARNTGVAAAKGDFVMFHDADDWAHPRRIERQVAAAAGGASVTRYFRMDASGRPVAPTVLPYVRLGPICLLGRRELLFSAGPIDEVPRGSDSEFLARLDVFFGRRRIVRDPSLLTIAGWSQGSISGDPEMGLDTAAGRLERAKYREEWMVRHARRDLLSAGKRPI